MLINSPELEITAELKIEGPTSSIKWLVYGRQSQIQGPSLIELVVPVIPKTIEAYGCMIMNSGGPGGLYLLAYRRIALKIEALTKIDVNILGGHGPTGFGAG